MAKENSKEMQDKTLRLIIGIILVLISLPALGMLGAGMMGFGGIGMMSSFGYGFGFFSIFWFLIVISIFILGLYLIIQSIRQ
ncbi:hypothetical protein HYV49_01910 [Candidatus Pacearchaeota archaeon]|nr:hypothetical protein [Candidatus Pacearchaeota archaeon]